MLRRLLSLPIELARKYPKLQRMMPLFRALDTFCFEPAINTKYPPYVRDAIDLKRWMVIVVLALLPCTFMAIWNTGVQSYIYSSGNLQLMDNFIQASKGFSSYFQFIFTQGKIWPILGEGLLGFIPLLLISYTVGGIVEVLFAVIRGHEVSEGFLVSGLLYPLILPPTIPYWMVIVGVVVGVVLGKEVFGGTGMNILNPALTCRAFLYFGFPAYMSGEIWVGRNSYTTSQSLIQMNQQGNLTGVDAISQESCLGIFNLPSDVKRIHVDTIANHNLGMETNTLETAERYLTRWSAQTNESVSSINELNATQLQEFVTSPLSEGGLGLGIDSFPLAEKFTELKYGLNLFSDSNLFWGNKLGSLGEVSIFCCILGALLLLVTKVGSWRTMLSFGLGVIVTAFLCKIGSHVLGIDQGAWNRAAFDFPIYKHFLIGSIAFGIVFMATDPVSSPSFKYSLWIYGFLIGMMVIIIRTINPAYPEGVMLAILFANVFAPLFDYYTLRWYRSKPRVLT